MSPWSIVGWCSFGLSLIYCFEYIEQYCTPTDPTMDGQCSALGIYDQHCKLNENDLLRAAPSIQLSVPVYQSIIVSAEHEIYISPLLFHSLRIVQIQSTFLHLFPHLPEDQHQMKLPCGIFRTHILIHNSLIPQGYNLHIDQAHIS